MHLSWRPGWISLEWHESDAFIRLTTRAPPSAGHWGECDFDQGLLYRFKPADVQYKAGGPAATTQPSDHSATVQEPPKSHMPAAKPRRGNEKPPDEESESDDDLGSLASDPKSKTPSRI